jgi:hypothetical protein
LDCRATLRAVRRLFDYPSLLALIAGIAVATWGFFFGDRNLYLESDPVNPYLTLGDREWAIFTAFWGAIVAVFAWAVITAVAFVWRRLTIAERR